MHTQVHVHSVHIETYTRACIHTSCGEMQNQGWDCCQACGHPPAPSWDPKAAPRSPCTGSSRLGQSRQPRPRGPGAQLHPRADGAGSGSFFITSQTPEQRTYTQIHTFPRRFGRPRPHPIFSTRQEGGPSRARASPASLQPAGVCAFLCAGKALRKGVRRS